MSIPEAAGAVVVVANTMFGTNWKMANAN